MTRLPDSWFNSGRQPGKQTEPHHPSKQHVETPEPSDNATQRSSLRSTLLLALVLIVLAGGVAAYTSFLVPVRYELSLQPESLPAIPGEKTELRVYGVSRSGSAVPWSGQMLRCDVLDGADLVELSYSDDSTRVTLTAKGTEGLVNLRIRIPDWPFPLLAELRIAAPLACVSIFHTGISKRAS